MTNFAEQSLPFLMDEATATLPVAGKQPSYIANHRQRLRARFMQGGAAAMPDYELLELVLFRAIPRRDVKPLAHALMDRFGDFNRVVAAPEARLRDISGVGDNGCGSFLVLFGNLSGGSRVLFLLFCLRQDLGPS